MNASTCRETIDAAEKAYELGFLDLATLNEVIAEARRAEKARLAPLQTLKGTS